MVKSKEKKKSEIELLQEINVKLGILVDLALEDKDKSKYVSKLRKMGLNSKLVGDVLGVSDSTVRNYK